MTDPQTPSTNAPAEPERVELDLRDHDNGSEVSDMKFKAMGLISSDPSQHVKKIKAMEQLGATAIVIMNISGRDPLGMVRVYGEEVLPALRDGREG